MNLELRRGTRVGWAPLLLSCVLHSCGDCEFEKERAEAFLADPENQRCVTDADCAVTQVACLELEQELCGQTELNKQANDSKVWRQLRDDLAQCLSQDSCEDCGALLIATCNQGSCRSPRIQK